MVKIQKKLSTICGILSFSLHMNSLKLVTSVEYMNKTKSKLALFIAECFYSHFNFIKIKYFISFQDLSQQNAEEMIHASVICTFIKNQNFLTNS